MAVPGLKSRDELIRVVNGIDRKMNFKDAHLELLSSARMDAMIEFLRDHFYPDETLSKSLKDELDKECEELWRKVFCDELSLILVSDKNDEIIACRGIVIGQKDKVMDLSEVKNENFKTVFNFMSHKNDEMNIFKRFDIDTCVYFYVLGTHKDYRKQGLASQIFQAALLFCKELGLDPICIKGEGSSNYSQRIYEKNNFENIHTFPYDEYLVNGDIVFKNTGEQKCLKVYVKKLD